ncbi:YihY/virulence factor BrkB family protein [Pseudokineococcus lusitanus]|uniref:Membrane protein n=1 Tax=Pseudokineococcus lusitanus TaxID=763993 RepID=A0A3N1HKZ1_9ACTN|nr:YhjD/YihY/BrkB family envelope integrity protein [Pseudokineococcus lusitanus]ROP43121.1 membrane protein [Pseudokineococcus lusitanus]
MSAPTTRPVPGVTPAPPAEDEAQAAPGLVARLTALRPVRAYLHFSGHRGNVLAGGIAFVGLFSLASILVVAVSVLGLVFGSRPDLQARVYEQLNETVPGLLTVNGTTGLLDPDDLLRSDVLSVTGVVAFVVALVAGLGWLDALREGIRAVFTEEPDRRPVVGKKLKDLLVLVTLGLAVLVAGAAAALLGLASGPLLALIGVDPSRLTAFLLAVVGFGIAATVYTGVFLLLFRVLADVPAPLRDLRQGAVVGGVALALVTTVGGALLRFVGGGNPVVAASATLGAVLVWLGLLSRITLVAAAWGATAADDAGSHVLVRPGATVMGTAVREDLDVPAGPRPRTAVTFDQRTTDRTTLAAGAVLGVVGAGLLALGNGAVRAVGEAVRGVGRR